MQIPRSYGSGGSCLTPWAPDSLALAFGDVATDLAAVLAAVTGLNIAASTPTAVAAADPGAALADAIGVAASTVSDPPTQAEVNAIVSLVNELRTATLAAQTRVNEIRTLILDLKARQAENRTLLDELKTDLTAGGGAVTLLTTKGAGW